MLFSESRDPSSCADFAEQIVEASAFAVSSHSPLATAFFLSFRASAFATQCPKRDEESLFARGFGQAALSKAPFLFAFALSSRRGAATRDLPTTFIGHE